MQIVYLTNRPAVFHQTLSHVAHYMPFVDDIVAVSPASEAMAVAQAAHPACAVTVLTDEEIAVAAGIDIEHLKATDHTSRNYLIRTAMLQHDAIAAEFIMADDDNRPLQPLTVDTFRTPDGRARRYFFYELDGWQRDETPFDQGLSNTLLVLRRLGLERPLAYASHMPQLIDRELFKQVALQVQDASARYPVDEWSMYFNLGPELAPHRFAPPEPFVTLGWPQFPGEWPTQVRPANYLFENHHPELYRERGLFAGLNPELHLDTAEAENLEKAVRWHRLDLAVRRLEFPDDIDNPWIAGQRSRKAFFKSARAVKKLVDYANLDDRASIADLTGRVRMLEDRLSAMEAAAPNPDGPDPAERDHP